MVYIFDIDIIHYYQLNRRVSKFDMFECCDDEEDDTEADDDDMDLVTMFGLTPDY